MYVDRKKEIEKGLGTIGRIKIMAELAKKPNESFTKYALLKGTGLKRSDLNENLKLLTGISWVKEHRAVHLRYQINLDNHIVQILYDFFKKSEYI